MDCGNANFQCRNVACGGGCVHDLDRESMKEFSVGSKNLTKLKRMSSIICIGFSWYITYGSGRNLLSLRNLPSFYLFKNLRIRLQSSIHHIYSQNNVDLD